MGIEIISYEDLNNTQFHILLKKFYGGKDRGTCYSITFKNSLKDCVEITEAEFCFMIYKKLKNEYEMIQNKDTLYSGHIKYLKAIKPLIDYYKKTYGFD